MPPITLGKTPANQLAALPLLDADTTAAGGVVQIVGGVITRFFDPTITTINAIATTTVNTKVCVFTPFLNLVGCTRYAFILRTTNVGVRAALPACSLQIQYRMGPNDTPSVSYVNGGAIADIPNAIFNISSGTVTFPATAAGNETQTAVWAWNEGLGTSAPQDVATVIGSDVRFIVSWSTNPVAAANLFTAYLWASS